MKPNRTISALAPIALPIAFLLAATQIVVAQQQTNSEPPKRSTTAAMVGTMTATAAKTTGKPNVQDTLLNLPCCGKAGFEYRRDRRA